MLPKRMILRVALLLVVLPIVAHAEKEELVDGLWYEQTWRKPPPPTPNGQPRRTGPLALAVYTLEVDPTQFEIRPALAYGKGAGLDTVSNIAKQNNAVAAINGGFFKGNRQNGAPEYAYKIEDTWYADSTTPRSVLGWNEDADELFVGRLKNKWSLSIDGKEYPTGRVNQVRQPAGRVLYTPAYNGRTFNAGGGVEIGIQNDEVIFVHTEIGSSKIPKDGYVYSIGPQVPFDAEQIEVGMPAIVMHECIAFEAQDPKTQLEESDLEEVDYIVNGIPIMITEGEKVKSFAPEGVQNIVPRSIVTGRHPRTAVGLLENGHWLFVVVDGRQQAHSMGMTIDELANFMLKEGCVEAINLDGGASASMYLQGQTKNRPGRGRGERPVSDAILVLPRSCDELDEEIN